MKKIPPNMKPNDIRKAMLDANVKQATIARELGVSNETVYSVIEGRASHRVREHIAQKIGIDIKRIWPNPYLLGGPRKAGRPFCCGHRKKP
jgi:lambda repressor-like predicted transcriptional regulator